MPAFKDRKDAVHLPITFLSLSLSLNILIPRFVFGLAIYRETMTSTYIMIISRRHQEQSKITKLGYITLHPISFRQKMDCINGDERRIVGWAAGDSTGFLSSYSFTTRSFPSFLTLQTFFRCRCTSVHQ